MLGGHVSDLALDGALVRGARVADSLGHAEVDEAGDAVDTDQPVLRGDVTVDDPERLAVFAFGLVRRVQALEHSGHDGDGNRDGDRAGVLTGAEELRKRLPRDVIHHEEELAAVGDHVEDRHDVRVLDAGCQTRLVEKHRDEARVLRVARMELLDGDDTRKARGAGEAPEVDRRHPTGGDLARQGVPADGPSHPISLPRSGSAPPSAVVVVTVTVIAQAELVHRALDELPVHAGELCGLRDVAPRLVQGLAQVGSLERGHEPVARLFQRHGEIDRALTMAPCGAAVGGADTPPTVPTDMARATALRSSRTLPDQA